MTTIVGVHGIGQQLKGEEVLRSAWHPALADGIRRAGGRAPEAPELACAFYGDLFRAKGKAVAAAGADVSDLDEMEMDLVASWWQEAARIDAAVVDPATQGKGRTPAFAQRALNALSNAKFFARISESAFIGDLKQVTGYMRDQAIFEQVQTRMRSAVTDQTRVIIGHSLGSVVAYEALVANPDWPVRTLITLGSPLGIRNIVFDRLRPKPGAWPGRVDRWVNVADNGDVVALEKQLSRVFGTRVEDLLIHNGSHAHDISPYLTAAEVGKVIAEALRSK
jgi:hypothetical protein